jgi:hypothetical protein
VKKSAFLLNSFSFTYEVVFLALPIGPDRLVINEIYYSVKLR